MAASSFYKVCLGGLVELSTKILLSQIKSKSKVGDRVRGGAHKGGWWWTRPRIYSLYLGSNFQLLKTQRSKQNKLDQVPALLKVFMSSLLPSRNSSPFTIEFPCCYASTSHAFLFIPGPEFKYISIYLSSRVLLGMMPYPFPGQFLSCP